MFSKVAQLGIERLKWENCSADRRERRPYHGLLCRAFACEVPRLFGFLVGRTVSVLRVRVS